MFYSHLYCHLITLFLPLLSHLTCFISIHHPHFITLPTLKATSSPAPALLNSMPGNHEAACPVQRVTSDGSFTHEPLTRGSIHQNAPAADRSASTAARPDRAADHSLQTPEGQFKRELQTKSLTSSTVTCEAIMEMASERGASRSTWLFRSLFGYTGCMGRPASPLTGFPPTAPTGGYPPPCTYLCWLIASTIHTSGYRIP